MITVGDMIRLNAKHFPEREAIVGPNQRWTYGELNRHTNIVAAALRAHRVGFGDRVAVLARNSLEYTTLYFATAKIGAILVPLNVWHRAEEHAQVVADAAPSMLLFEPEFQRVVAETRLPADLLQIRIPPALPGASNEPGWESLLAKGNSESEPQPNPQPSWPHMILYTSGTTGRSKGAILSQERTMLDAFAMAGALRIRQSDTFLNYFPAFHVGNWDHMKLFLLTGARVVLMREFDSGEALRNIETERVSVILGIPATLHALLNDKHFTTCDLSSVRLLYYGAYDPGGIIQRTVNAFGARDGRIAMAHSYGLTEAGPFVSVCLPEDLFSHWGSIGRPIPGVEVELQDDSGESVAEGEPGEICVRGPRMDAYWRNPTQTEEALKGGWLHTGDIAVADRDGFMWIIDRKKDMIRTGGQNVYSRQVEECLQGHPAVNDVAVIGVPDEVYEEAVCAVVVPSPGRSGRLELEEELKSYVREHLAGYNVPRRVEFIEQLPKNAVGKTMKHVLRERFGSVFDELAHGGRGPLEA